MLGTGDRLTFRSKECAFKTVRGQKIELSGVISSTTPRAIISNDVASLFADQISENLSCAIEIFFAPDGFEYIFRSPPQIICIEEPRTYRITTQMLDAYYVKSHSGHEPAAILLDISRHLNHEGAEAIRWFLLRLHLQPLEPRIDPFVLSYHRMEVSWTPPEKLPGYEPLRGKPSDDASVPATQKSGGRTPMLSTNRRKK